jgi:hypothetical protein
VPTAKIAPSTYELKITLLGIEPPIWRRLQVPSTIRLCCLHSAIQVVMGWTDSHLHHFEKDGTNWGVPEWDEYGDLALSDERRVPLDKMLNLAGEKLRYFYDYGDDWQHEVLSEQILPACGHLTPVCLAGERHRPPEDVGGTGGYEEFLEVIFQPDHEEFDYYRRWAGDDFDPEHFNLEAVNDTLSRMRWPVRHRY